jgi:DNA-binding SARP family transcriptional activator
VRLRILGPLEVVDDDRALDLGAHKQQALLGVLALRPREVVSTARLIDELWGESPPASAAKAVQGYVSGLRKALGGDAIVTKAGGYLVSVDPDALDAERFDQLVAAGRESVARDPARAAATLREALALWRGDPLEGLRLEANARIEVQRLAERRLTALELRIEADLALGRHAELVGELQELAAVHPYREGLAAHLMLALYRSGRQAEALSAYRRARQQLTAELGLEPSESLRQLERQVLAQDPQLDLAAPEAEAAAPAASAPPAPPPPAPSAAQHARRLVTVLAGRAVATDAEALHAVLERAGGVVERFGGTVERYLGDMVIGLFGLTEAREDDALRAVRAALELQGSDGAALQMGIESGEIFVGGRAGGATFATGAAITAAGRLAERAADGQVLLGEAIRAAVAADVRVDAASGRLLELRSVQPGLLRVSRTPFVGRARELGELRAILARTSAARACHMVTILGPAGLGKSRLAAELLASGGDETTVLVGRCRSDAEGVTYRVLAELVAQLGGDPRRRIAELLADDDQARGVLGAVGLSHEPAQTQEAFWAIRTLLERLARDRPLVVAIEDIHWAEPLLLDLLEYVVAFARSSPILLLCMARPELLEARPSWAAPQPDRSVLVLEALAQQEATALVQRLGATGRISNIVRRAEGNPLFLEQLVAVDAEHLSGTLPASIQAVLAARIDGLEAGEADVLRHAAVEGRTFHAGAVVALLPEDERSSIDARLVALARKGLIRADRAEYAGEAAFRFDHALIRDAAYEAIPKRVRTDLHVRIAEWIDVRTPGGSDELVGYHLEQACRLPAELGVAGARERALAARAAERFALAARAAQARGDPGAAARLLERGASLLDADDRARVALLPALGAALFDAGRQADADRVLTEALRRTRDPRLSARAEVEQQFVRLLGEGSTGTVDARRAAGAALRVLQEHGDEHGQSRAWSLHATIAWFEGRAADADDAWQRAAALARRTRDERELFDVLGWRASAAVFGPTPVREAIRRCTEIRETVRSSAVAVALTLHPLATLHAMSGEFEQARRLLREANEILHELGGMQSAVSHHEAVVERLAGRHASAEALLRDGYARLAGMGDGTLLATTAAMLAQAVHARGDLEEAEQLCLVSRRGAPADDILTQVIWRGVQARILAQRGSFAAAERLAREAVGLIVRTDFLTHHGDALLDLAEVLRLGDRAEDSYQAARAALSLYERKGNIVAAARVRSRC